jgi:hypothetical protein
MTFSNANNATFNLQAQYRGSTYTRSDVALWIKKQWATMVRRELEQDLLLRQFCTNVSFPQGKVGDTITIPTIGRLAANRKVAGVPVNLQRGNTGSWSIQVTQYTEASFMIDDIATIMLDPSGMLQSNLAKEASYALKRDLDAFLLGLRAAINANGGAQVIFSSSNGQNIVGSASQPLTINALLRAKLALDNIDVPAQDRVWIVSPTQYLQLLAIDKVQSMFFRTSAPLENGIVGTLLGTPVYMTSMVQPNSVNGFLNGTTAIPTPGVAGAGQLYFPDQDAAIGLPTTWNATTNTTPETQAVHTALLVHKDCFSLAMLQEPKTEYSRETLYLSDAVVISSLYGARLYRPLNAVIVHTNASIPAS